MKLSHCLSSETRFRIVVIGNYKDGPIRWYHAERKFNLYAVVDPVSPPSDAALHISKLHVVEAPGTAPGSDQFITKTIYRHSQQADIGEYSSKEWQKKGLSCDFAPRIA